MRYVTLEGHHKIVYAYHFALLSHFRYPQGREVKFPFFIAHSMRLSMLKCKVAQDKLPRHQGVIKLIYDLALVSQPPKPIGIQIDVEDENIPLSELFKKRKKMKR